MLTRERNTFTTQVAPDTPMGKLFRQFWLPLSLPEQHPEPDGDPVRLRLLGEDMVTFRDSTGQVGVVDAFSPHRPEANLGDLLDHHAEEVRIALALR